MTIFVEDKLKPSVVGDTLADAVDVATSGGGTVEAELDSANTSITTINTTLTRIGNAAIAWDFNNEITEDPPFQSFRFNNADPEQATIIYVDKFSVAGRFDEYLDQFPNGGFIYLQDRTNRVNNFLFRTTAALTSTGGANGWYVIPVENLRSQSTISALNGDRFTFIFLGPASANSGGGGTDLPNMFLNEISTEQDPVYTRKIDTEATVRMWLRAALVQPSGVNDPGTGLVIAEANGDLAEDGDTFQDDQNLTNVYLYISLDTVFDTATDLNTVWVVRKDGNGDIRDAVNMGANFIEDTSLSAVASGEIYVSNSGYNGGGSRLNYSSDDTIELFFQDTADFFTISETNAPNVDLTRAVKTLGETQLDDPLTAKVNFQHGSPYLDQFKLDQLVAASSESAGGQILTGTDTFYFKKGAFSDNSADYFSTDFNTGLPPNLGSTTTTWTVVVPNRYTISGAQGSESGNSSSTLLKEDVIFSNISGTFKVYQIPLPDTASDTNTFSLVGTLTTVTEINPTDLVKIDRTNVQADFLSHIENPNGTTSDNARLTALENKVSTLYPLARDVDPLTSWGDIYIPERAQQEVVITDGYDLIADYRGDATRYESTGVTYSAAGVNVVLYTGLSESLQRVFGFKVNAPADQVLMWLADGAERIPFIDMTAAGNYRVNNYTQAAVASQPTTETTRLNLVAGDDGIITTAPNVNARFIIPDYPSGATVTSRSLTINLEILLSGVDTLAGHFEEIDIPETNVAQDRVERTATANLGPQHGNQRVTFTYDYRFVVAAGNEYRIIFTLISAPANITVQVNNVFMTRTYTPAANIVRTDNFEILGDALGNYTFTGENELVIAFQPAVGGNTMRVVPVAIDSVGTVDELNDDTVPVPFHGFSSVEIPDAAVLTGFEFRTARLNHFLIHDDLANLLTDRTVQWFYGKARLRTVATIHAISEAIDLASGSTLNGGAIGAGIAPNIVQQSSNLTTGTDGLVSSVILPADYTNYAFVHIAEFENASTEWRHTDLSTVLLSSGIIDSNHSVRLQGATDMTWDDTTRTLALVGGVQEIAFVYLHGDP